MKKMIYWGGGILGVCLFGAMLVSGINATQDSDRTSVMSMTVSPEVPKEVSFAGEKLKLDRYDLYERYDREISSFTYLHSSTLMLFKRANRIFPIIEPILKENNMPDDLKYLAVIESMLDVRAISPAKAAGLWQFMPATATGFGLEVSSQVDERYSVELSTKAACKYLKSAYAKYGSWASVAMSYNAGMGRISSELGQQQVADGTDLWLVEETSRYYFRMLAVKNVFENPRKYGFVLRADQLYKPIEFKEVKVNESIPDLASFAKQYDITYAQLKDFNSWLRDRKLIINPKSSQTYTIKIPLKESLYYGSGEVKVHNKNWIR